MNEDRQAQAYVDALKMLDRIEAGLMTQQEAALVLRAAYPELGADWEPGD